MTTLAEIRQAALATLRPPARIRLSAWIEASVCLPRGLSASPGPMRLWAHQRAIADSIGDASVERVSVLKSARIGFTSLLSGVIAHHVVNDPAAVLVVLPVESDCRGYLVDDLEPCFECSPSLRGRLKPPSRTPDERSTILHRFYDGGSLKLVASHAPRNLRRHTARILLLDEIDAMQATPEGDPVALAEKRTLSFRDRKIVAGSTPLDESTSAILRCYNASDMRVYEIPCPHCRGFFEVTWATIRWPSERPEEAHCVCPACEGRIEEREKGRLVAGGRWRATAPSVQGHHGFRLSSLISPLPNAAWPRLAQEFLAAKADSDLLKVFVTTVLGEAWRDAGEELEEGDLASRAEAFDLEHIPAEVLAITIGADCQDDRLEVTVIGWTRDGTPLVLDHRQLWGRPPDADDEVWRDLDGLLRSRFLHPLGGVLKIDAACVDGGDGAHFDTVMKFCGTRLSRKIMCIKGVPGFGKPMLRASKSKRQGARLFLIAVDVVKSSLFARLERPGAIRFSASLGEGEYFTQLTSEVRRVRMRRGRPVITFERRPGCALRVWMRPATALRQGRRSR